MPTINLTLPWPPTTNNLYLTVMMKGRPVRVPSKEAKVFKKAVGQICQAGRVKPFIGSVAVSLNAYRPRRVGDIDNVLKAVLDSLKGYAWGDDAQVTEIHAYRHDDKFQPRVEIEIREIIDAPLFQV